MGDPVYMAPELFSSEGMDAASFASDFWALGCVLFELLTGEPPFGSSSSGSSFAIAERVEREVRVDLRSWRWIFCPSSAKCGGVCCWATR